MIITQTPFRVSLFGGGTDYAEFFKNYDEGMVVGFAIDKYSRIVLKNLPKFFDFKTRVCYYKIELVQDNLEIEHKAIKGIFEYFNYKDGVELFYCGDLPSRSGTGSSSSFSVGLIQAIKGVTGEHSSREQLATTAIDIEHNILKENVGYQDQVFAAYGGFNIITFNKYGYFVKPIITTSEFLSELQASILLVHTGISRTSSEIVASYIKNFDEKIDELRNIKEIAKKSIKFINNKNIKGLGHLLDESWKYKRSLSKNISNPEIDRLYETAISNGAYGGKIMGGGGGGFMLFIIDREKKKQLQMALSNCITVDVGISWRGSEIIYAHK